MKSIMSEQQFWAIIIPSVDHSAASFMSDDHSQFRSQFISVNQSDSSIIYLV